MVADQLTLHAKRGRLQRNKIDILERRTVHGLAKHKCWILASIMVLMKVTTGRSCREVAVVVRGVEKMARMGSSIGLPNLWEKRLHTEATPARFLELHGFDDDGTQALLLKNGFHVAFFIRIIFLLQIVAKKTGDRLEHKCL